MAEAHIRQKGVNPPLDKYHPYLYRNPYYLEISTHPTPTPHPPHPQYILLSIEIYLSFFPGGLGVA